MNPGSFENLKIIRFEGQMLPHWAQLLDLAARLSGAPDDTRSWFSRFVNSSGVDDARTVIEHCNLLSARVRKAEATLLSDLKRHRKDAQPQQVLSAWNYALETILQEARSRKTCSWLIDGESSAETNDAPGGDISLRRT